MGISRIIFYSALPATFLLGLWLGLERSSYESAPEPAEKHQEIFAITFGNLPEEERQKYISKADLFEYGGYIAPKSYTQNFIDENVTPLSLDVYELQNLVRELSQKNQILAQDNVGLSEKNLEFISEISDLKQSKDSEKDEILNRIESRHAANISELTRRLNEAQTDMIESSKGYERKIVDLENRLNEATQSNLELSRAADAQITMFKQGAEANASAMSEQNARLVAQIEQKQAQIDELSREKERAALEIETAKKQAQKALSDGELMAQKFDKEQGELRGGLEILRQNLEKEIALKTDEISRLQENLDANISALSMRSYELSELKSSLKNERQEIQSYSGQNLELNASLNALQRSFDELKNKNEQTQNELKAAKSEAQNFKKELEKKELEIVAFKKVGAETNATVSGLLADISRLENEAELAKKELQSSNFKDSQNAKILLEQNATIWAQREKIESANRDLHLLRAKFENKLADVKNLENNVSELGLLLSIKQNELDAQKRANKIDAQNYEILRAQLKMAERKAEDISAIHSDANATAAKFQMLENELEEARKMIADSNKTIDQLMLRLAHFDGSQEAKSHVSAKIAELEKDIEQNLDKQDRLEDENVNLKKILQAQTKPETPTKVVLISSLACEDMDAVGKISVMCKNRVSEFLQRFTSNYIYEIVPIVDKRNFVIPTNVAQSIKKDELGRLNNYVNYGVGKERAKAAAELIKDEFGDFARISFSSEVIVKNSERGFVIKVYR